MVIYPEFVESFSQSQNLGYVESPDLCCVWKISLMDFEGPLIGIWNVAQSLQSLQRKLRKFWLLLNCYAFTINERKVGEREVCLRKRSSRIIVLLKGPIMLKSFLPHVPKLLQKRTTLSLLFLRSPFLWFPPLSPQNWDCFSLETTTVQFFSILLHYQTSTFI